MAEPLPTTRDATFNAPAVVTEAFGLPIFSVVPAVFTLIVDAVGVTPVPFNIILPPALAEPSIVITPDVAF
jgi:hypothetical protein